MKEQHQSGLATAAMVLGIIAIVGSWIPFLNIISIILGVLALIFGLISLFKKRSLGKAITGVILGVLTIIIAISMLVSASKAIDDALSPTQASPTSETEKKQENSTKAKVFDGAAAYDKVKNGMTKQEVREVAGVDPNSCYENEDETFGTTEYCTYGNMFVDEVTFDVTYSQGKVTSKSKSTH